MFSISSGSRASRSAQVAAGYHSRIELGCKKLPRLSAALLWVVLPGLLLTGQSAVKAQTQCPGAWTFSVKTKVESGVVDYYKNGVRQSDDVGTTDDTSGTTVYTGSGPALGAGSFRSFDISGNSSAHIYYKRQVVVTCTWGRDESSYYYRYPEASYPTAPVPSKLSFTYQPDAVARAGIGSILQADDGWADVPTGDGLSVSRSTAKRLYSQDSNGQSVVTATLPVGKAEASLQSSSTGSNTSASAEVYVVVGGFTSDSRGVRIVRNGAPTPKSANDPTLDKSKDEWVDADGTGHGHTTHSESMPNGTTTWNNQTFTANVVRAGHQIVSWSWSPQGSALPQGTPNLPADTETSATRAMSPWQYESQQPIAPVETYTYKATFEDGVVASANYQLTIHTDYEDNSGGVTGVAPEESNVRRHPYSTTSPAATSNGQTLTASATNYAWSVSPRFLQDVAAGRWIINRRTGLTPDQQFINQTGNLSVSASAQTGQSVYVQIYDLVTHSWGTANHFTPTGYAGQTQFEFYAPNINQLWGYRAALQ